MYTDTHCHIYQEYYENIDEVLENAKNVGVTRVINNGCDAKSNIEVIDLVKKYPNMYGAIGIHPEYVDNYTEEDIKFLEENIKNDKIVAIGEIGLDYHYTKENKIKQIELLEKQLKLAEKYNMPVIIHSRETVEDIINTLKKYKVKGVIHAFSGSLETAKIFIKMGFLIGVGGVVTFKNAHLKEAIKEIPLESIVLETDSPYLSPEPFRGKQNEPARVKTIAEFIAGIKDINESQVSIIANQNIKRTFDI